jgi:hypothetical protein
MPHFAGQCQLILQGQFNAFEHHIPIDPFKHHLVPVIQIAVFKQAERLDATSSKIKLTPSGINSRLGFWQSSAV